MSETVLQLILAVKQPLRKEQLACNGKEKDMIRLQGP